VSALPAVMYVYL